MRLLDRSKYEIRTAWSIFTNLYYHGNDEQKISKTLKTVQYDFGKHAEVRALAFHECGLGSIPGLGVISGWSLLKRCSG